jgi:predicted nucleic acid-binding protein
MKPLVVDASVAIKWFIPEDGSIEAVKLLGGRHTLIAPDLIRPEVCSILWKLCSRRLLTIDQARRIIDDFLSLPVEIHDNESLVALAFDIAAATGRTVYDCLYLALAIESGGVMITADKRLANALKNTDFAKFLRLL